MPGPIQFYTIKAVREELQTMQRLFPGREWVVIELPHGRFDVINKAEMRRTDCEYTLE